MALLSEAEFLDEPNRAPFLQQAAAWLVDQGLSTALGLTVIVAYWWTYLGHAPDGVYIKPLLASPPRFLPDLLLMVWHLRLVYFLPELWRGQSLGKLLLRLKIGASDGSPGHASIYFTRYMVKMTPHLLLLAGGELLWFKLAAGAFVLYLLGGLLALLPGRQALHDRIAQTAVYQLAR